MKHILFLCILSFGFYQTQAFAQTESPLTISPAFLYLTAPRSAETKQTITVTNSDSLPALVSLSLDTGKTIYAPDTKMIVTPDTVVIPPYGSITATVTFTMPAHADFVLAVVAALALPEGTKGFAVFSRIGALSENTKYASYQWAKFVNRALFPKYTNDFAILPPDTNTVAAYDITKFDIVNFVNLPEYDYDQTVKDKHNAIGPPIVPLINAILDAGHGVLITSTFSMNVTFDPKNPRYPHLLTPAVTDLFDMLGVHYLGYREPYGLQLPVTGIKGDVISDGIIFNHEILFCDSFSVDPESHSKPFLYFYDNPLDYAGFHYDNGSGHRLVYIDLDFGYELDSVAEQATLGKLISNSMDWLLGAPENVKEDPTSSFILSQNYPNPVSNKTQIGYILTERSPVSLTIHDLLGGEVAILINKVQEAGSYSVNFDASSLPSGSYIYTLNAGGKTSEKTMTVIK